MAMRCFSQKALTLVTPTVGSDHAGGGPCFIHKHQRSEVKGHLANTPYLARDRRIQPVLPTGDDTDVFLPEPKPRDRSPHAGITDLSIAFGPFSPNTAQRHIRRRCQPLGDPARFAASFERWSPPLGRGAQLFVRW